MQPPIDSLSRALAAIDKAWDEVSRAPIHANELGRLVDRLPQISEAEAERRSALGKALLAEIDAIDRSALPGDLVVTLAIARERAASWARESDWYWLVIDPSGTGFFGIFAPTAYCGGFILNSVSQALKAFRFDSAGDLHRYLGLATDYGRLVRQMTERTKGQAARGIHMPRLQLEQALVLIRRLKAAADATLTVAAQRLDKLDPARSDPFATQLQAIIANEVHPAFDALLALLDSAAYRADAPDAVGLSQYPGGAEIYAELVRMHTTLPLTPSDVHARGLARMERVRADMAAILRQVGFAGTPADYLAAMAEDPAWRAEGAEALQALFRRYIDRIAPAIPQLFRVLPQAGHDAEALPAALSSSMTFGYYGPAGANQPKGTFFFNAENLSRNPLPNVAALNYHELVPGHHFHLSTQRENKGLHPLRQFSFVNAYNEGWAEYAATLAGELGMYAAPEERFGRLMMDAFLTCRLVVDTGMNALGWSLEDARAYMRANGFMPEAEVQSETLRYSSDIPGQSLAYKLGDDFILELRETMKARLGNRFDIRDFHQAVLGPGALPLPLLKAVVEAETERLLAEPA